MPARRVRRRAARGGRAGQARARSHSTGPPAVPRLERPVTVPGDVQLAAFPRCEQPRATLSSVTAPATTPAGCTAFSATAVPHPAGADQWHHGLRIAGSGGSETTTSRTLRGRGRRRRLHDDLQELATAMQYGQYHRHRVNNGIYATIRMHQEREYPGRVIGTDMVNPDFVKLAEAHGAYAERVVRPRNSRPRSRAVRRRRPALIESGSTRYTDAERDGGKPARAA